MFFLKCNVKSNTCARYFLQGKMLTVNGLDMRKTRLVPANRHKDTDTKVIGYTSWESVQSKHGRISFNTQFFNWTQRAISDYNNGAAVLN
jgi:hypothetical protein